MLTAIPRQSQELAGREFLTLLSSFFSRKNYVSVFEKKTASFIGVREAIAFHSLRQGLFWVLKSLDFKNNDEIILPAYEFFAIPATIIQAKLKPVFVDVSKESYTLDSTKIEKAITKKTKAIVVAHLNGYPAEMDKILELAKRHKLRVIEDCAHAFGAEYKGKKVGSFDIGCFSFGFGKPISTAGGGMVTTNDGALVKKLRTYQQGFEEIGFLKKITLLFKILLIRICTLPQIFFLTIYPLLLIYKGSIFEEKIIFSKKIPKSFRLKFPNLQAALGIEQLKNVHGRDQNRIKNASFYNHHLAKLKHIQILPPSKYGKTVYLHYPIKIRSEQIDNFIRFMLLKRINVQKDYCCNCSFFKIFSDYPTHCPVAKNLAGKIVFLPNHPSLGEKEILYISRVVKKYFQKQ